MRRGLIIGLLAIVLVGVPQVICADMKSDEASTSNVFSAFADLPSKEAKARAREMAEHDFAAGTFRVLVAGKRPYPNKYDDYLKEKYGVTAIPVAGCVVSDGLIGAIEGYNATMKPLLNRKFGRDIFQEAQEASQR